MKKIIIFISCIFLTSIYFFEPVQAASVTTMSYAVNPACILIFTPPDNLNLILYITMLPVLFLIGLILGLMNHPFRKKQKESKSNKKVSLNDTSPNQRPETPVQQNNAPLTSRGPQPPPSIPGNNYRRYW